MFGEILILFYIILYIRLVLQGMRNVERTADVKQHSDASEWKLRRTYGDAMLFYRQLLFHLQNENRRYIF